MVEKDGEEQLELSCEKRFKEQRNILYRIQRRKANWLGDILRRNCRLKHIMERKLERERRPVRIRNQLLYDVKEKRRYLKLKEDALGRTLWRIRFGTSHGPVARQAT
jgi:hypothetical protein